MAKTRKAVEPEIIDVPESPEVALILQEQPAIVGWFNGLRQFFHTATELETDARSALAQAQTLMRPTTSQQATQMADLARTYKAGEKRIEGHWDQITSIFHGLHKRGVAKRKTGTDCYARAYEIANGHVNVFNENERRRVIEENNRLRREAEERARQDRELELQALEEQAVAAEAASADLSDREREFVRLFTSVSGSTANNGPAAARVAGYKKPENESLRLLKSPKIQAAIQAVYDGRAARQQADAVRQQPVIVEHVTVQADTTGGDRTTWSCDVYDEQATIAAALAGDPDLIGLLAIDRVKANKLAQRDHERIDLKPGLRHIRKTRIV